MTAGRSAFTLVEILISAIILGIVAFVVVPTLSDAATDADDLDRIIADSGVPLTPPEGHRDPQSTQADENLYASPGIDRTPPSP